MKWGLWSTTAASNSATPPDGWPEGQAPSTVNDCAREMMAAIATGLQDIQFVDLGFAPTQTSGSTFTVSGTHADVIHYGRRLKMFDGVNTLYATVISATATSNTAVALRFDTGTAPLDASLSSFAIGSPAAANNAVPENVYRNKNYIQNGQFDIWQRGGGPFSFSAANTTVKCSADRWVTFTGITSAGATFSITRGERSAAASNVPTLAQCGVLLNNCIVISVNAALSTVAAADYLVLQNSVEGFNWRQIAQKPTTLSFWVNSTITGTYCSSLGAPGGNGITVEYTISAAATWEKKTITFPPSPATGTWDYSSGAGIVVKWTLGAGSNQQGTANTWSTGTLLATVNQTQFFQNGSSTFKLAAVKFEEGTQATPLPPVDYAQELALCQRYLYPINGAVFGFAVSSTQGIFNFSYPTMRVGSLSASLGLALSNLQLVGQGAAMSISAITLFAPTAVSNLFTVNPVGSPLSAGNGLRFNSSSGAATLMYIKSEL